MTNEEKELKVKNIQAFRYGIISEITNPYLRNGERIALLKAKASRKYDIPYTKRNSVSLDSIRKWLSLYRKYGIDGLAPKIRNDFGRSRSIPQDEKDIITSELEKDPELTATAVIKRLQRQGQIKSEISKSSLSRFIISSGLRRCDRLRSRDQEKTRKFNFFYPLECIQADDMHGFLIPDGKGSKKKAILISFIDDATRRIVYSDFSFTEKSLAFEKGIKHILSSHGRIGQVYVDNGSTFVATQTKRILDSLGIPLMHSRPYIPKGRGKIERFFRTVRDQFIRPLDKESIKGLGDLNVLFKTWLETEYHRTPHRGIENKTPLDKWLSLTNHIVSLDPSIDLDKTFLHVESRTVYKDSTFTLKSILFEAPSILIGKKVKIFYNPNPPIKKGSLYYDGKFYGDTIPVDTYANTKVRRGYKSNSYSAGFTVVSTEDKNKTESTSALASLSASRLG